MKLTTDHLNKISGNKRNLGRKKALCQTVNETAGTSLDLTAAHELAQFIPQIMHESGNLRYVKEVWGPTRAQSRYEGREDLGNTKRGDGKRFMGRDIIQVTGRANYRALTAWLWAKGYNTPDFEEHPDQLEDPQFLGLGALWYWSKRVPARFIEAGNIEMITRRINGGLNGFSDRLEYFDRTALVFLGYARSDIAGFQAANGLVVDGISGPLTRAEMNRRLKAASAPWVNPEPLLVEAEKLRNPVGLGAAIATGVAAVLAALAAMACKIPFLNTLINNCGG